MSNTAELCARLLEHAAIHDRETSPYSPEQAAWAADLRDAAALIQAAPVVERADSATGVVECGSLNVSDNAQPAASGEPVATVRRAHAGGRVRNIGFQVCNLLPGANVQDGAMLYAAPQPAPARVPLADEQIKRAVEAGWLAALKCHAEAGMAGWSAEREAYIANAIEAAHGITAQGEPK